jgi:hypothetical protein
MRMPLALILAAVRITQMNATPPRAPQAIIRTQRRGRGLGRPGLPSSRGPMAAWPGRCHVDGRVEDSHEDRCLISSAPRAPLCPRKAKAAPETPLARIDTVDARSRLKPRVEPYWTRVDQAGSDRGHRPRQGYTGDGHAPTQRSDGHVRRGRVDLNAPRCQRGQRWPGFQPKPIQNGAGLLPRSNAEP